MAGNRLAPGLLHELLGIAACFNRFGLGCQFYCYTDRKQNDDLGTIRACRASLRCATIAYYLVASHPFEGRTCKIVRVRISPAFLPCGCRSRNNSLAKVPEENCG